MAYELFYAFATTSTTFEVAAFLIWFLLDLTFASVAIMSSVAPHKRRAKATRMVFGVLAGMLVLRVLTALFPDEREQLTAYWTGLLLQFPIGWGSVYLLLKRGDTKGHSLEIWLVLLRLSFSSSFLFFLFFLPLLFFLPCSSFSSFITIPASNITTQEPQLTRPHKTG